jgi:hypothetical protein
LHTGVVPLQSAAAVHCTHVPFAVLHTGVAPTHAVELPIEHCPHAPDDWQAGVLPPHSPSPEQPRQLRKAGSQTGVEPAQSVLPRQPTQVFVDGLQSGVAPPQVELVTQATQVAVPVLHAGVAPPQWVPFVAEHSPQAPLPRHTGAVDGHSTSPPQARQACVPLLHTGCVPEQLAFARHPTQTLGDAVVRQYGVEPPQSEFWAHPSMVTGVGGTPGPPPLPSDS